MKIHCSKCGKEFEKTRGKRVLCVACCSLKQNEQSMKSYREKSGRPAPKEISSLQQYHRLLRKETGVTI